MPLRYNPKLKALARELRKKSTLSEVLLWQCLSKRQRGGHEFRRQKPVNEYIVDFFAPELMLAVEIDGRSHKLKGSADDARQRLLEGLGIWFLRFQEMEVRRDLDAVVQSIDNWIEANVPKR